MFDNRNIKKLLKKHDEGIITHDEISMAQEKYGLNLKYKNEYTSDEIKEHIDCFEFKYNSYISFLNNYEKLLNVTSYLLQDKNLDKKSKSDYLLVQESLPELYLFVSTSFERYIELYSNDLHIDIKKYKNDTPEFKKQQHKIFDIYNKNEKEDEFIELLDQVTYNIHDLIYTIQYSKNIPCKINFLSGFFSKVCNRVLIYFYHDIANISNHRDTKKQMESLSNKSTIITKHHIYFQNINFDNGFFYLLFSIYKNNILRILYEKLKV